MEALFKITKQNSSNNKDNKDVLIGHRFKLKYFGGEITNNTLKYFREKVAVLQL